MSLNGEVPKIEIPLHWKPVLVDGKTFDWHRETAPAARDREQLDRPQVYRWLLKGSDGSVASVYVGQTGNFQSRLSKYRAGRENLGWRENFVRDALMRWEDNGGTVELEFLDLDEVRFDLNGTLIDKSSLGDHEIRLMMESIAVVATKSSGIELINRLEGNVHIKRIERLLKEYVRVHGKDEAIKFLNRCMNLVKRGQVSMIQAPKVPDPLSRAISEE